MEGLFERGNESECSIYGRGTAWLILRIKEDKLHAPEHKTIKFALSQKPGS